jgi:hypothetical protein
MKLDLRFTPRPLETLWCEVVVAFVFKDTANSGDGVSGLDDKTSGYLSSLWKKGFWTGIEGESLLVASQGMIKADKMLLKGLGSCAVYRLENFAERLEEIGDTLERMGVRDFGIRISVVEGFEGGYHSQLRLACEHLVTPFLLRHGDETDFLLKIVVSVDDKFFTKLEPTVQLLKRHFTSRLEHTIIFDKRLDNV